jgi:hypothetical protein
MQTRTMKRFLAQGAALGLALTLAGCGDDDGGATGDGTVTEAWAGFCTATFTEDKAVLNGFGEPLFTARAGSEYLMSRNGGLGVEFFYLTGAGPETFEVEPDDRGEYPFTTNCGGTTGVPYNAVFADVSVFAEERLTTKICDLSAGTAVPSDVGTNGYSAAGEFNLSGPATYEIILGGFAEQCGNAASGFVSVPQTVVFGSHTWLVPIQTVLHP